MDGPKVQTPQVNAPFIVKGEDGQPLLSIEYAALIAGLQRVVYGGSRSGTTAERPTSGTFRWTGMPYMDTTLGKPVFLLHASSNVWVDGVGTVS